MKNRNSVRLLALAAVFVLVTALFAGCSAKASDYYTGETTSPGAPMENGFDMDVGAQPDPEFSGDGALVTPTEFDPSQKLIYRGYLQVESLRFDEAVAAGKGSGSLSSAALSRARARRRTSTIRLTRIRRCPEPLCELCLPRTAGPL